ncbi:MULTISPECIES: hypothetical protein [Paenibacillus]|uniref:Uncharacterized protein n=1 Tax=Paenibacillus oceani TaxID=2772510 RepID=A0A927GYI3_9BACL|nr:hypothetical protein [Paenibacillus oceani]MBD2860479.1 hypothetical protein [Paenibacillus oceani]MDF2659656.1 hypothetical protein [Paenibacillus sp.]
MAQFYVTDLQQSDTNEKAGLYQFLATFSDKTKARVFYTKNPDWKITSITRLLTVPCPICRKDYFCNCLERFSDTIHNEIVDSGLLPE